MLLRNINPSHGLCNGTRLIVTRLHRHCIRARIIGGSFNGKEHVLFRVKLSTNEGDYPWILTRKQFPIRLSFAMTINKSQGQTLTTVGLDLRNPCFSHGQLYVGLSRVTDVRRLSVLFKGFTRGNVQEECLTANVIFPEVLLDTN